MVSGFLVGCDKRCEKGKGEVFRKLGGYSGENRRKGVLATVVVPG
jgi:hypothetical protein